MSRKHAHEFNGQKLFAVKSIRRVENSLCNTIDHYSRCDKKISKSKKGFAPVERRAIWMVSS